MNHIRDRGTASRHKPDGSVDTRVSPYNELIPGLPDGSLVITPDQQAAFGFGNARYGRKELRAMFASFRDRTVRDGPTPKPASVRIAKPADEQGILDLLMVDLKENAATVALISEERILDHIQAGTRTKGGFVGIIDGPEPGKPVAVVMLHPCQWWWSQAYYYVETALFVHPEHRKSHHFDDLLSWECWLTDTMTKRFGYRVWLICGVLGAKRTFGKVAAYRRRFTQVGAAFIYPSPPVPFLTEAVPQE